MRPPWYADFESAVVGVDVPARWRRSQGTDDPGHAGEPAHAIGGGHNTTTTADGTSALRLMHDEATGLVYNRARYLNPELGRFMSEDPLGYVDGGSLYEYAGDAPAGQRDPVGAMLAGPVRKFHWPVVVKNPKGGLFWYQYEHGKTARMSGGMIGHLEQAGRAIITSAEDAADADALKKFTCCKGSSVGHASDKWGVMGTGYRPAGGFIGTQFDLIGHHVNYSWKATAYAMKIGKNAAGGCVVGLVADVSIHFDKYYTFHKKYEGYFAGAGTAYHLVGGDTKSRTIATEVRH